MSASGIDFDAVGAAVAIGSDCVMRNLGAEDVDSIAAFFRDAVDAGDTEYFHPHPFTVEEALRICRDPGRDIYSAAFRGSEVLAYGLLRGWNDGWQVPSLGIIVGRKVRGSGLSKAFMSYLHAQAGLRGATSIRLRVAPGNVRAMRLYRGLGYEFLAEERGELVGRLRL